MEWFIVIALIALVASLFFALTKLPNNKHKH
jgi:hypothetical protein